MSIEGAKRHINYRALIANCPEAPPMFNIFALPHHWGIHYAITIYILHTHVCQLDNVLWGIKYTLLTITSDLKRNETISNHTSNVTVQLLSLQFKNYNSIQLPTISITSKLRKSTTTDQLWASHPTLHQLG